MSHTYVLQLEVPGGLGPRAQLDTSIHPPRVDVLHVIFDGWLGDQLVKSFPCHLVTANLAQSLVSAGVTGFELSEAEIEMSDQFREFYPTRTLPEFKWLKITGTVGENDFFITAANRLGVTRKALDVILATAPTELRFQALQ